MFLSVIDCNFICVICFRYIHFHIPFFFLVYRLGRCTDTLYAALKSIHLTDPNLRHTVTLSRIGMAMYLFTDHVVWLGRAGLADVNTAKWSRLSYRLWLYYLVMNLSRDIYEISRIINNFLNVSEEVPFGKVYKSQSLISKLQKFCGLLKMHKDVAFDTVKNGCDVCLPLAQLGYLSISPRTVGLLGAISSIAGMLPLLDPSYKLSP